MPRSGRPPGLPPRAASRRTAAGITPSPHALSMGVLRGSATVTERPASAQRIAVARPTGPPPATRTSITASPPQQHELGAYPGTEADHEAGRPVGRPLGVADHLKDVQHRRRGHVADLGEGTAACRHRLVRQLQCPLHRVDYLGAAWGAYPDGGGVL